jgi:2-C-methyl-D-erythritol 4-phosphate cytidylyltransferase
VVWTVIVAGGSGSRFGGPKQFELLGDERMIDRSLGVAAAATDGVVLVVPGAEVGRETGTSGHRATVVAGGRTRSESVRAGLAAVPDQADIVCVHDAARPFASAALYRVVIEAVAGGADGAIPGVPVTDTVKLVAPDGCVESTPPRDRLVAVQTPQAFRADRLRRAHLDAAEGTDDAALVEAIGGRVVVVAGEPDNRKVTHPDDLRWARELVEHR